MRKLVLFFSIFVCLKCFKKQTINTLVKRSTVVYMDNDPIKQPRKQNVAGNLYVDESCIDCDVCRWMCPSVFSRTALKAAVHNQPNGDQEKMQAYAAMVSCPVGAIRTRKADPLIDYAFDVFPAEIDPERIPGVYHLGYHSSLSYGATPYFIKREKGNVMIDSPRFNTRLVLYIMMRSNMC